MKPDALSSNLLHESNGRLVDGPDFSASPYTVHTAFAVTPTRSYKRTGNIVIAYDPSLFVNSSNKTMQDIAVDYGSGYTILQPNANLPVSFGSAGEKVLKFRARFTDGTTVYSHAKFLVMEGSMGTADYTTGQSRSYRFPRSEDTNCPETFPDPRSHDGLHGATVTVDYGNNATRPGCNPQFNRPLIVVEGFDAHKFFKGQENYNYEDFILDDDNGGINIFINSVTAQSFNDALDNAGYDLVFIDFDEGTGDITQNARLVENVIEWVNAHKAPTADENVIWGVSMGGLVARYALADLEKRWLNNPAANPHHETRLLFTHDAPHRGANVPLGLQMAVTRLHDKKLAKLGLVNYGIAGAIIGSSITLEDIAPAIGDAHDLLNEPASRQMLILQDGRTNTFLDGEYRNMVSFASGYTPTFRMIASSNGSECGEGQPIAPYAELVKLDANFYANRLVFGIASAALFTGSVIGSLVNPTDAAYSFGVLASIPLMAALPFTGKNWQTKVVVNAMPDPSQGSKRIFYARFRFEKKVALFFNIKINIINESANSPAGARAWDHVPGGAYDLSGYQMEDIHTNLGPSFFPVLRANLEANIEDRFTFVPTVSALDIEGTTIPPAAVFASYTGGSNGTYPSGFDSFITQPREDFVNDAQQLVTLNNSEHVLFTQRNANWLFDEMQGNQSPPASCLLLCNNELGPEITGPETVCTEDAAYTITNVPPGATLTWSHSNNLVYVSGQSTTTYTVRASTQTHGDGFVSAAINNNCVGLFDVTEDIHVGKVFPLDLKMVDRTTEVPIYQLCRDQPNSVKAVHINGAPIIDWEWQVTGAYITYDNPGGDNSLVTIRPHSSNVTVELRANDGCGWTDWADMGVSTYNCTMNNYIVFPNPTTDFVNIRPVEEDKSLNNVQYARNAKSKTIRIEFWHPAKGMIRSLPLNQNMSKINVNGLDYGLYFIKIISPERTETHYMFLAP